MRSPKKPITQPINAPRRWRARLRAKGLDHVVRNVRYQLRLGVQASWADIYETPART